MLITEGAQFESWTSTVVLKAERGPQPVTLRGRPQGAGELKITGYSSTVMGVSSNCRLKFIPHMKIPFYTINVVSALPFIQVSCLDLVLIGRHCYICIQLFVSSGFFFPIIDITTTTIDILFVNFPQILTANSNTGSLGSERAVSEESGNLHLSLSAGETQECSVVLHNISSQPVEEISIALESKMDKTLLSQVKALFDF